MSTNQHDSDFFDVALRQIHHDARQGAVIPEQTPLRQLTDTVCAAAAVVTAPIRKYMQEVNNAPYAPETKAAPKGPKSEPDIHAADFLPVRAMTSTGEAAEVSAAKHQKTPRKAKMVPHAAPKAKSAVRHPSVHSTPAVPPDSDANTAGSTPNTGTASIPAPSDRSATATPRRTTRTRAKKKRASPWTAVLLITIVMLGAATGLWLVFGYRTAESTATRYAQALYSGDADALYDLYTKPRLTALARTKRFTSVDEFLTSEQNRLARSRESWELTLGPNYSIDVKLTDLSEKYRTILSSYAASYEVSYNLKVEPEAIRWFTADITLRGNQQALSKTKPLILVRVGTWWYVFDTPAS